MKTAHFQIRRALRITLTLKERAFLVKLFYQNDNFAPQALWRYWTLKGLQRCPITANGQCKMIMKFEQIGSLGLKSGKGRKCVAERIVEDIATAVEEEKMANCIPSISV